MSPDCDARKPRVEAPIANLSQESHVASHILQVRRDLELEVAAALGGVDGLSLRRLSVRTSPIQLDGRAEPDAIAEDKASRARERNQTADLRITRGSPISPARESGAAVLSYMPVIIGSGGSR